MTTPTTTVPSGWKTTTGLLDDFDFDISEAFYGVDKRFMEGKVTLLHLRGEAFQPNSDGEMVSVDEEHTALYSCGDGWEIQDGGQSVAHTGGKDQFNNSSNIGRLIDAIVKLGDEAVTEITSRGDPTNAEIFVGLRFHMERIPYTIKDRVTKLPVERDVLLPTAYLGLIGQEEGKKGKAVGKAVTKATPRATPKAAAPKSTDKAAAPKATPKAPPKKKGTEDDLRAQIVTWGAEYAFADHTQLVETVFDSDYFPGADALREDDQLTAEVLDPESELVTTILGG